MKKFLLSILLTLSLMGCASSRFSEFTTGKLIILKDNPEAVICTKHNAKGQKTAILSLKKGDTVNYSGRFETRDAWKGIPSYFYKIENNSKYYFLDEKSGICIDRMDKGMLSLWAKFPKEKESEIWSLAISFVMSNTDMKIQTQTDMILQTFNPSKIGQRGWTLNKIIKGNQVEIVARCSVHSDFGGDGYDQVKRLYYYLNTGRIESPNFFID